jgi:hypothetical protein
VEGTVRCLHLDGGCLSSLSGIGYGGREEEENHLEEGGYLWVVNDDVRTVDLDTPIYTSYGIQQIVLKLMQFQRREMRHCDFHVNR